MKNDHPQLTVSVRMPCNLLDNEGYPIAFLEQLSFESLYT